MKTIRSIFLVMMIFLGFVLMGCEVTVELDDNEVQVKSSSSSLVGTDYEDVVSKFESWGFTNIQTEVVYDIIWGITKEGTTKSVKIGESENFSSGDIFEKNVSIIVTYSMKASNDPTKQKYSITWQYEDGTIIETENVLWGNVPSYTGDTPYKESTNETKYTFSGWTPEVVAVTGEKVYTAVFTESEIDLNKVDVVNSESYFVGKNFEEVVEILQDWGFINIETVPVYDIIWDITEPGSTKNVTINGSDTFKNGDVFDKDVLIIITYSMRDDDDPTKQKYTITWQYEDGTIIKSDELLWGSVPMYTGNTPSKNSTNEFKYTFNGWAPEIETVTGDKTYVAQFIEDDIQYQVSYLIPDQVVQIISGGVHYLAITNSGQVYSWGMNFYGQLGDGTTKDKSTPVNITEHFNLSDGEFITKIEAGSHHSIALTSLGRVFSWGKNNSGILGDGTTVDKSIPTDITQWFYLSSNEKIINVFAGERGDHSLATSSSGRIFSWGNNQYGQLGDGTKMNKIIPVNITGYFGMTAGETINFAVGDSHTLGVTSTGRVFSWGRNNVGQLGHGTTTDEMVPVMFNVLFYLYSNERIISLDASLAHSLALTSRGRIFTWGTGNAAQHPDGTYADKKLPTDVTSYFNLVNGETIVKAYSIGSHAFAITSENRLFGWGHNLHGQTGDGTTVSKAIPIEIASNFDLSADEVIVEFVGGFYDSLSITSKGRIFAWGWNFYSSPTELQSLNKSTILKIDTYRLNETIIEYIPIREGYTFGGWYTDEMFSESYLFSLMPAQNIDLYGKWVPND